MTYQAPHPATDQAKLAAMVAILQSGKALPPIVVEPNGVRAICGSHRIAAARTVGVRVEALVMSEADYTAACKDLGVEWLDQVSDYNEVCAAVARVTTDEEIRVALEDQQ